MPTVGVVSTVEVPVPVAVTGLGVPGGLEVVTVTVSVRLSPALAGAVPEKVQVTDWPGVRVVPAATREAHTGLAGVPGRVSVMAEMTSGRVPVLEMTAW
ncbi:MAG: hypothetical protein ACYCTI_01465 [Acidimicrobiales bacterium]